jgi:three-Cys-motif partner protein
MEDGPTDDSADPYVGREQTKAKHFILKGYLQELAFKILTFSDFTYVDGFSGPWETQAGDYSDSSFMIAIHVLRDAQQIVARTGKRRKIRLILCEMDRAAYGRLQTVVAPFHDPANGFEITTIHGKFEDAVPQIQAEIGASFPLIFIDPKGWKGYPLDKIKPLFKGKKCEVVVNFMYAFISRFANDKRPHIIASLDPILGGPNWNDRLDPNMPRGAAVEKLFRETLKQAGGFDFVVSTKINKAIEERTHFYIVYGTKDLAGLLAFRKTEYRTLKEHEANRANARESRDAQQSGQALLMPGLDALIRAAAIDDVVKSQCGQAQSLLLSELRTHGPHTFDEVLAKLLPVFMIRETNVKQICHELAKAGVIDNTWGKGNRRPKDDNPIRLKTGP